jgi:hypothetical protein
MEKQQHYGEIAKQFELGNEPPKNLLRRGGKRTRYRVSVALHKE